MKPDVRQLLREELVGIRDSNVQLMGTSNNQQIAEVL